MRCTVPWSAGAAMATTSCPAATSERIRSPRKLTSDSGRAPMTTTLATPTPFLAEPRLEHQHVPQVVLPVEVPGEVLCPLLPDGCRVEVPLAAQAPLAQKLLGPVAQRAAQP